MSINVNYEGLSDVAVSELKSFEPIINNEVDILTQLSERLEAGTPTGSRRAITNEATAEVGDEFAKHVVKTISDHAGENPLRLLGMVKTMQKAVDEAFAKQIKAYVDARIEELEAGTDASIPKLSDDERAALVAEYSAHKQKLDMFYKVFNLTDNGDRMIAAIPEFKTRKVSSGPRKPGGPRIGGFEFVINGSVVAKAFPALAKYLQSVGMEDASALSLKQAIAVENKVDSTDEAAFKALFQDLAKRPTFSWPLTDGEGNVVRVVARAVTESTNTPDEEDDDDEDNSESE